MKFTKYLKVLVFTYALLICGCDDESNIYTLYRDSPVGKDMRIHMATFDSKDKTYGGTSEDYNRENCKLAASLFQAQPNIVTTFWCEKGRYRK